MPFLKPRYPQPDTPAPTTAPLQPGRPQPPRTWRDRANPLSNLKPRYPASDTPEATVESYVAD